MRISELKRIIEDVYIEVLSELHYKRSYNSQINESLLDEIEDEETSNTEETPDVETKPEQEDATEKILKRFPSIKKALIKLQTEDYKDFVDRVDWISPRPSSFRVNLKNGQDYILKWTGKSFEVEVLGKKYLMSNIADYQQALDKLAILYKEAPMVGIGEEPVSGEEIGQADTSGGTFPGEEGGGGGSEGGETPEGGGEELGGGEETGGENLANEPVDFESGESGTEV